MPDPASLLSSLQNRIYRQTNEGRGMAAALTKSAAVFVAVLRDLAFGEILLRATSLVYTTLLSIVPMLALTFSVSKAFGVHDQIEPALRSFLEPIGPKADEITTQIIGFINNMHVGVLGSVGLVLLLFTAITTILKIETAINAIWHVKTLRSLSQRISSYLSILLLGPLLVFSALGMTAALGSSHLVQTIISVEPFGHMAIFAGKLLPYVLVIILFLLIYMFLPNTRVRIWPALISALVAGIAWQSAGWGFTRFVASSTQYTAIYSGLAILIIFMIWLYVSWTVVLSGASVGFYTQHPEYLTAAPGQEPRLSAQTRDHLALSIMQTIAERHRDGARPVKSAELAAQFFVPAYAIDEILEALVRAQLVMRVDTSTPPSWVPARDLSGITVWGVLEAVRSAGDIHPPEPPTNISIQAFIDAQERFSGLLSQLSFRELLAPEPTLSGRGRFSIPDLSAHAPHTEIHAATLSAPTPGPLPMSAQTPAPYSGAISAQAPFPAMHSDAGPVGAALAGMAAGSAALARHDAPAASTGASAPESGSAPAAGIAHAAGAAGAGPASGAETSDDFESDEWLEAVPLDPPFDATDAPYETLAAADHVSYAPDGAPPRDHAGATFSGSAFGHAAHVDTAHLDTPHDDRFHDQTGAPVSPAWPDDENAPSRPAPTSLAGQVLDEVLAEQEDGAAFARLPDGRPPLVPRYDERPAAVDEPPLSPFATDEQGPQKPG